MNNLEPTNDPSQFYRNLVDHGLTTGFDNNLVGAQLLQALIRNFIQHQGEYGTFSFVYSSENTATESS